MEENEKIFEKARFLGIPVEGDSAEEKLQNIANHVGLPYNSSSESISNKLDNIYHDGLKKKNLQENVNSQSNLNNQRNKFLNHQANIQKNKQNIQPRQNINQYKNSTKTDEKLRQKLEKSRKIFQNTVNTAQEQQKTKKDDVKQAAAKKGLRALGVPSSLANLLGEKMGESDGVKPNITSAAIKSSLPVIGGILLVGLIVIICVLAIVGLVNEGDISNFI